MNGKIYLEKPPLFYWSGALFGLLSGGASEWVLRLPSALCAMGLVWMLFFFLKKRIGRWGALFSVLILATSSFFTTQARLAELEMLLTLCVFLSVLFYFEFTKRESRCFLYGAYALQGLAFLTKGPVALLFFVPPILCYGLMEKSRLVLKSLIDWRGWLLFSVIAFPWFIYVNMQLPGAPLLDVIIKEASTKTAGEISEPFYFYLPLLIMGFSPWILVLLWKPREQFKRLSATEAGRFFGLAAVVPLIIFSLFAFKRDKYILPMYPALAVWLGMALAEAFTRIKQRRRSAAVALTAISAMMMVAFIGYYNVTQARTMSYRYDAFPPLAARLDRMRGDAPVFFYQDESIQLVYYYGRPIPVLQKADLSKMLSEGKPFVFLATNKHIADGMNPDICLLEMIKPFGETNKELHIFAVGAPCRRP